MNNNNYNYNWWHRCGILNDFDNSMIQKKCGIYISIIPKNRGRGCWPLLWSCSPPITLEVFEVMRRTWLRKLVLPTPLDNSSTRRIWIPWESVYLVALRNHSGMAGSVSTNRDVGIFARVTGQRWVDSMVRIVSYFHINPLDVELLYTSPTPTANIDSSV